VIPDLPRSQVRFGNAFLEALPRKRLRQTLCVEAEPRNELFALSPLLSALSPLPLLCFPT
jgi:hypothetical protein